MKTHLINLLFEECELRFFMDRVRMNTGPDIGGLKVENYEIILDMIGFPKENKADYIQMMGAKPGHVPFVTADLPDGYFSREKLINHYYEIIHFDFTKSLILTHDRLSFTEKAISKNFYKPLQKILIGLQERNLIVEIYKFEQHRF